MDEMETPMMPAVEETPAEETNCEGKAEMAEGNCEGKAEEVA